MKILVIDGQGGRLGRKLVESIRKACPEAVITAVGQVFRMLSMSLRPSLPPCPSITSMFKFNPPYRYSNTSRRE